MDMANQQFVLFLLFSIATSMSAQVNGFWFGNIFGGKEKQTTLQLYVQDLLSGPTPTTIPVAFANSTATSPTYFGLIGVLDDPVRMGLSLDNAIVGRVQGILAYTSLEEISLHMTFALVFTSGDYDGSTLNVVGKNPYTREYREMSVVGGTGKFRLARGYIGVRTVSDNSETGDAIFQYNVTVWHY